MHELIIQICFVVAGVVTGCTDGHIRTSDPYLTSQDMSPVYVYDAPQCVSNHYHTSHTPSVTVGPLRLYWPTYTSHHRAHPWCTNSHSHYHGNHWYTWKKKYKTWNRHNHHAHRPGARHGHHKKHKKRKVIVRRSGPSKVVIKPKGKYNHHKKKVVIKSKKNKHFKRDNITVNRSGPSKVIIKPRNSQQRNWRRHGTRPKLNIPKNLYRPESKDKKGKKQGKKKGKKQNRHRPHRR